MEQQNLKALGKAKERSSGSGCLHKRPSTTSGGGGVRVYMRALDLLSDNSPQADQELLHLLRKAKRESHNESSNLPPGIGETSVAIPKTQDFGEKIVVLPGVVNIQETAGDTGSSAPSGHGYGQTLIASISSSGEGHVEKPERKSSVLTKMD